jgi:hypothetical protein
VLPPKVHFSLIIAPAGLKFKEKTGETLQIWNIAFVVAEIRTLWQADQKYPESSEGWCWRMMEMITWEIV